MRTPAITSLPKNNVSREAVTMYCGRVWSHPLEDSIPTQKMVSVVAGGKEGIFQFQKAIEYQTETADL